MQISAGTRVAESRRVVHRVGSRAGGLGFPTVPKYAVLAPPYDDEQRRELTAQCRIPGSQHSLVW